MKGPERMMILGGPGTGKTTVMMDTMAYEMLSGVQPEKIAFVSFTRRAVDEARDKMTLKFPELNKDRLHNVRTLHSMCFKAIGARSDRVMNVANYKAIGQAVGMTVTGKKSGYDGWSAREEGDEMIFLDNLVRTTKKQLKDVCEDDKTLNKLKLWTATTAEFKKKYDKIDFTDMLEKFIVDGLVLPVDVAIVDEAQDLSPLEWDVVTSAFSKARRLYVAGDDDQAIYGWSGADVESFIDMDVDKVTALSVSHRLPKKSFNAAKKLIEKHVKKRRAKDWVVSEVNPQGSLKRIASPSELRLEEGTWLLLSRNLCFLNEFKSECRQRGVAYTDAYGPSIREDDLVLLKKNVLKKINPATVSYYNKIVKAVGEDVDFSRVKIGSIHSAKGAEADSVAVVSDVTERTRDGFNDDEVRVLFVALTRSKRDLFIMYPSTNTSYFGVYL